MPVYTYTCVGCNDQFEDWVSHWSKRSEHLPCPVCSTTSTRNSTYKFAHQGGDDLKLEAQESALVPKNVRLARERAGLGRVFRSQKDVSRWEEANGLVRQDPSSAAYRSIEQDQRDDYETRKRVLREDGIDGLTRHTTKTDIQSQLGWSSARFCEWEDNQNAAAAPSEDIINSSIAECGVSSGDDAPGA